MGKLAEAYVDITGKMDGLDNVLARAKSSLTSFMGSAAVKGLAAIGLGGGIYGIGAGMLDAAKKASALGETLSKIQTTFGPAAKGVIAETQRMADQFGVVKQEPLDAAAAFGLMGQAAGLSKQASAGLANEMVQLGIDMASFHNLSNEEAFEKLRAGLSGEAEPLRPLGILLSDDAMKAEALASGLIKVKRELTEQEKVMARLAVIRKQAGPAIGDKARTSDSAENQMKQLTGDITNAATAFGEKLIPSLVSAMALARELGDTFKTAFGTAPVDAFTEAIKTAVDAARLVNNQLKGSLMVKDDNGRLVRRTQENSIGGFLGLTMRPAAGGNSLQEQADANAGIARDQRTAAAGPNAAQIRQQGLARDMAVNARFAAQEKQAADFRENARRAKNNAETKEGLAGLGRGLGENLKSTLGSIVGAILRGPGAAEGARAQVGRNLSALGVGGGALGSLNGVLAGGHAVAQAAQNQPRFSAQFLGDPEEFARSSIVGALEQRNPQEAQVKQLEAANDKLVEIKEGIAKVAENVLKGVKGLFPR